MPSFVCAKSLSWNSDESELHSSVGPSRSIAQMQFPLGCEKDCCTKEPVIYKR